MRDKYSPDPNSAAKNGSGYAKDSTKIATDLSAVAPGATPACMTAFKNF
jgi:hypothetical protein